MTQHTPGPWRLSVNEPYWITHPYSIVVRKRGVHQVAIANIPSRETISPHEAKANAVLIAAAPDLLQCLEKLLAVVHDRERDDATVAAVNAAEGLIARVRGDA